MRRGPSSSRARSALRRTAWLAVALAAVAGTAGCADSAGAAGGPTTTTPTSSPKVVQALAVPSGCPTPEQYGEAVIADPDWYAGLDLQLASKELATPLPEGGCAYIERETSPTKDGTATYQQVKTFYFNLGTNAHPTGKSIADWAKSAGGTPATWTDAVTGKTLVDDSGRRFDLPDGFSGFTGSDLNVVPASTRFGADSRKVIPAWTTGDLAEIDYAIDSRKGKALITASRVGEGTISPRKALAKGLTASFSASVSLRDESGYTVTAKVKGSVQPITSDVTDAPPGRFDAFLDSSVSGKVSNTTAGRNAQSTTLEVIALYPLHSAACDDFNGVAKAGDAWSDASFCSINIGEVPAVNLEPDAQQTVGIGSDHRKLGTYDESGSALKQLNRPTSVYLAFGSKGAVRADVAWTGDKGCQSSTSSANGSAQWFTVAKGWPDVICS